MADARLEQLRQTPESEMAVTFSRITPAVVELVEGLLERHKAIGNLAGACNGCLRTYWPCPDAEAALAVLDALGDPP